MALNTMVPSKQLAKLPRMVLRWIAVAAVATVGSCAVTRAAAAQSGFTWLIRDLTAREQKAMIPAVWRKGCPVPLSDLRSVRLSHWGYDGQRKEGTLVVHATVADDVVAVFAKLYEAKFPIKAMVPIERYNGSDERSIDDDNTSAFNCRNAVGSKRFSLHAYGKAIDLNPFRNPYILDGVVKKRSGYRKYMNRNPDAQLPGVIYDNGVVVEAFAAVGWEWGGRWKNPIDYQHFFTER
jgi:hypothetical protein